MNIGSKTAVSVLNEFLVSRGATARFDLIHNETGSHNPVFVYRVQALGKFADGEGRSKQQAKHQAARNLIDLLGILENKEIAEEVVDVSVPEESECFNAVGELADYCYMNNHPEPVYDTINEAGPPHAKIFLVRCSVSQIHECGESGKKKIAKQVSAAKMLRRLKSLAGEEYNALVPAGAIKMPEMKPQGLSAAESEVIERYNELKGSFAPDPAVKFRDHHRALIGINENSPTLSKLISNEISVSQEDAIQLLEAIATELKVDLVPKIVKAKKDNDNLSMYVITTSPQLNSLGFNENDAAVKLLDTLCTMCN